MTRHTTAIEIELLVLEAQSGNPKALPLLAQRYHAALTRRAILLTNNQDAAADIAQDTWVAIAKNIRSLRDPARFHAWASSILANTARDWIKQQAKRRPHSAPAPEQSNTDSSTSNDSQATRDAVMNLDPKLRDIVILIYMDRCTIEQAAAALAIPIGTAKSRLRKARETLSTIIEDPDQTERT